MQTAVMHADYETSNQFVTWTKKDTGNSGTTCPVAKEIWRRTALLSHSPALNPQVWTAADGSIDRFKEILAATNPRERKRAQTTLCLTLWHIWKERNERCFRNRCSNISSVMVAIINGMDCWRLAGAKCLETPLGDPGWGPFFSLCFDHGLVMIFFFFSSF